MKTTKPKGPVPFVFVKVYGNSSIPKKKILLPKTMKVLRENIEKVFPNEKLVSLLDKSEFLIESIREIESGQTIYLSDIDPAFCVINPEKRPASPIKGPIFSNSLNCSTLDESMKKIMKEELDKQNEQKKKEAAMLAKKTFSPTNSPPKKPNQISTTTSPQQSSQMTAKQQHDLFVNEMLLASKSKGLNAYQQNELKKAQARIPQKRMVDMRKISRPPSSSSSDDDEGDQKADLVSISSKMSEFLSQNEILDDDEESEELRRHKEEKKRKKLMYQSVVVINDERNAPFQQIIEEIIPPQDAPRLLEDGLSLISPDRQAFIQKISDWEGEHIYIWMKGAADQPFLKRYPMQPYHDPITGIVMNFLLTHRHITHKNFHYRFKAAVVGPKKSGKSTLLGNAVDNYILDLAATGLWKSTFILAIDIKIISPYLNDYVKFYQQLLDLVLDAICKQSPLLRPHYSAMRKQLRSVTEKRNPLIGIHPYRAIDYVALELNNAWRDPRSFFMWLNNVMLLPVSLAKAVGFKNVSLFIDNIEYADVYLRPHAPFDTTGPQAVVIEHVKFAISMANFILSAEQSERLFQILPPFDEDGIDLSSVDYITPYDTTSDLGSRLKYDYLIECREESQPIRVTIEMCGGIVPFIAAWDELHHSLFILERTKKTSEEYEEMNYNVISDAQNFIDKIFICEGSKKITVIGVKRDKKGEFKLKYDDEGEEK
ncbi:hypothetical protein TRFO_08653 [Tritrichomonas foetus]|uniref:Uncharacterized protein n=1 Tax=Tritrichomonas foetus TaxID=1144522 RepID=A0A1J4JNI8_9EUKA|nr:hypothetical protein TRFO_08653 [Tritrichomonas foetus]|eukprot:OHS99077.1 hypothetical protein TRFO_08653 [Tritrichomonas foetus]